MNTGLYIHVPFCIRKCPYCDFYSVPGPDEETVNRYTEAVIRNIRRYTDSDHSLKFDTVYFGGGTPSVLPPSFYERVLGTAGGRMTSGCEVTMETNPKTSDKTRFSQVRSCGVNRISVGIQSASDTELGFLGRIHNFADAERTVSDAFEAGFDNISGDLMTGIKGQSFESLVQSVDALAALGLNHISSYILKIEEGTEYARNGMISEAADEDTAADMYLLSVSELEKRGYFQYEISNFSKPGYESRHNLKYWNCEEYIGIGPSAHSYFNNRRYGVPGSLQDFISSEIQTEIVNEENPGGFFERAMLALRLTKGMDFSEFPDECPKVMKRAEKFLRAGLIRKENNNISLTPEGFLISNYLISELLAD